MSNDVLVSDNIITIEFNDGVDTECGVTAIAPTVLGSYEKSSDTDTNPPSSADVSDDDLVVDYGAIHAVALVFNK